MDVQGDMVQDMYDAGRLAEINDYCRCDVLDTYFVFLRTRVLLGQLDARRRAAIDRPDQAMAGEQGRQLAGLSGSISTTGAIGRTRGWAVPEEADSFTACFASNVLPIQGNCTISHCPKSTCSK